jgi:hypothetical protein
LPAAKATAVAQAVKIVMTAIGKSSARAAIPAGDKPADEPVKMNTSSSKSKATG